MLTPPKPPKPPNFEKGCPPNIPLEEFLNLKVNLKRMAEDFEALKNKSDPVNNPAHYTAGKIQAIDFIEDQKMNFHLGVALQYIIRAGKKDETKTVEDLQKAIWYINRFIDFYASENKANDK